MILHCKLYKRTKNGLKEIGSKSVRATLTSTGLAINVSYPNHDDVSHDLVHAVAVRPNGPWRLTEVGHYTISKWTRVVDVFQDIEIVL
jgi:uncharacterized phage-associated protein